MAAAASEMSLRCGVVDRFPIMCRLHDHLKLSLVKFSNVLIVIHK